MSGVIAWHDLPDGPSRITCPTCGRGPKDRTLGVTIEAGAGVAHCYRCQLVESFRESGVKTRRAAPAPVRRCERHEWLSDYGQQLWSECRSLRGTVGAAYLDARCAALPPEDGDLRFHAALKHPAGYRGPALVALVSCAVSGRPMSLHRTWIRPDGSKADVDPPRLLLGGHRKQGGVIRLWPDEAVSTGLGIAEGIETALTLAHAFKPVWSAIDAGNLAAFPVLAGIQSLMVAADNDPAGLAGAHVCARHWSERGREVRIVTPAREGADLNDVAREAA